MQHIILTGPKGSGKSTIGRELGALLNLPVIETDEIIERLFREEQQQSASCRVICREYGEEYFRRLEARAVQLALALDAGVICTGGQTLMHEKSRRDLSGNGAVVMLKVDFNKVWKRIEKQGFPPFFPTENPGQWYAARFRKISRTVEAVADIILDVTHLTPEDAAQKIAKELQKADLL